MVDDERRMLKIKGKKDNYEIYLDQSLGKGGFANVYRGQRVSDGREVAIKKIHKRIDYGKLEITHMEELSKDPKNVYTVKLLDHQAKDRELFLILPFYKHGSLRDYIKKNGNLDTKIAGGILMQLINALKYLHQDKQIMHRDLTSANVMIKDVTSDGIDVLLGDFGLAKSVDREICRAKQTTCGTPGYMPPEIKKGKYQPGDEVYSLGGILYNMLTGREPDTGREQDQLRCIKDGAARTLLEKLWEKEAINRPTLQEMNNFQFLNQYRSTIQPNRSSSRQPSNECKHRVTDNGRCNRCKILLPKLKTSKGDSAYESTKASNQNTKGTRDQFSSRNNGELAADKALNGKTRRRSRTPSITTQKTDNDRSEKELKWPLPSFKYFQSKKMIDETRIRTTKKGRFVIVDPTTFIYEALSLDTEYVEYIYEISLSGDKQELSVYVPRDKKQQLPEIGDDLIQEKRFRKTITSLDELGQYLPAYKSMLKAIEIFYARNAKINLAYVEGNSQHTAKLMYDGSFRFIFGNNKIFIQKPNTKDGDYYTTSDAKLTREERNNFISTRNQLLRWDRVNVEFRGKYYKPYNTNQKS